MLRYPLIWLIRLYQVAISPLLPPSCRFHPTCSEYAREAVCDHGPVQGVLLAVKRLLRCHPFSEGGYDPVPVHGRSGGRDGRDGEKTLSGQVFE